MHGIETVRARCLQPRSWGMLEECVGAQHHYAASWEKEVGSGSEQVWIERGILESDVGVGEATYCLLSSWQQGSCVETSAKITEFVRPPGLRELTKASWKIFIPRSPK